MEMDQDGKCVEETSSEQLLPPDSLDVSNIFGDPMVHPRIGNEFQVEIPPMITKSEHMQLFMNPADAEVMFNVSHSFLMGLPIPIMWVHDQVTGFKDEGVGLHSDSNYVVNENGSSESKKRKKFQISSSKKDMKLKVEPLDVVLDYAEELKATSSEPTTLGKTSLEKMYGSKNYRLVPGSLGEAWSDIEVDSFLLGLYIFGKNLIQVKRFMESREMGEILTFYYGKFYWSHRYRRWSDCRKMRSRKCILGQKLFTGWRQHELLSRLLPRVSEEFHNTLLEVSKKFAEGITSLEEYVSTLKATVGIRVLTEAIGIGKGKEDLTGLAMEPTKTNQVFPIRPEIPVGKACSSLTSRDIIKFLTGDFRLSKARSNDLFWEAVWPRLLARGWHSEQPKNRGFSTSKHYLVFLMPGVKKFSRRKLVKGDHYFDSVSDVLSKVASEPKLLELEAEEARVNTRMEGTGSILEAKADRDDLSDQQRHCYLKPRVSTCNPNPMKFTVVDTSLVHGEKPTKVRELKSLPLETEKFSKTRFSRENEGNSSEDSLDEPDSANMPLNGQKITDSSNGAKGKLDNRCSNKRTPVNNSDAAKKLVGSHQVQIANTSDDKQSRMTIKHQFSRRVKSGNPNHLAPLIKRRRLTACAKADTSRSMENLLMGPRSKQEESGRMLELQDANNNVVSHVDPSQEKGSSLSSSAGVSVEESSEWILNGNCFRVGISHEKNKKPEPRPLIDLNVPQVPPGSENGEPFIMEIEDGQRNPDANVSFFPSDVNEHVENLEASKTSVDATVSIAEQQPVMNPRRQSTRNRPLTTRALEALAGGYLSRKRRRKRTEVPTRENFRPSRRVRSRVTVTSNSGNTGTAIVESKEEKGMDGVCNGDTNMISKSLVQTEEKWITGY
ncbi:hypothetical protein L1049_020023 [Liquidambar formosana]|uniref:SANT domain-containing protein n=1 Tax=Liquidambar formosana TaxID=63359 RepID=A0AAP0S6J7_LIQFO